MIYISAHPDHNYLSNCLCGLLFSLKLPDQLSHQPLSLWISLS